MWLDFQPRGAGFATGSGIVSIDMSSRGVRAKRGHMEADKKTGFTRGGISRTILRDVFYSMEISVMAINPAAIPLQFGQLTAFMAHADGGGLFRVTLPARHDASKRQLWQNSTDATLGDGNFSIGVTTPGEWVVDEWIVISDGDDPTKLYETQVTLLEAARIRIATGTIWPLVNPKVRSAHYFPNCVLPKGSLSQRQARDGGLWDLKFQFRETRGDDNQTPQP